MATLTSMTFDPKAAAARWRAAYNPLRGLTFSRAVEWLESYERGEMADVQWTFRFVERTDPDMIALVERRISAVLGLTWKVKIVADKAADKALAEAQKKALEAAYAGIDNIYEAVEHLAMASFRGFAHLEKHIDEAGRLVRLEPCDQWNVVRDGTNGPWKYNPEARVTSFLGLPDAAVLDPEKWITREVERNIDRVALIKFVRQNLSQKDWDAFIESLGRPPVYIVGPPQVPAGKEAEYEAAAKDAANGNSGYLPNGSTVVIGDTAHKGQAPFRPHLDFLREQLVLAGTGGLLTMLVQSGSGTLAGSAHQDAFDAIAHCEARKISEILQRQIDKPLLAQQFPGRPVLAYWELCAEEENDTGLFVDQVLKLSQAGYQVDPAEISEKVGLTVTLKPQVPQMPPGMGEQTTEGTGAQSLEGDVQGEETEPPITNELPSSGELKNRRASMSNAATDELIDHVMEELSGVQAKWLQGVKPFFNRLVLAANDNKISDAEFVQILNRAKSQFPELFHNLDTQSLQEAMEKSMGAAAANGMITGAMKRRKR